MSKASSVIRKITFVFLYVLYILWPIRNEHSLESAINAVEQWLKMK